MQNTQPCASGAARGAKSTTGVGMRFSTVAFVATTAGRQVFAIRKSEKLEERMKEKDEINHPRHYTSHPSGVECIQITEHMSFCPGNAIKYIWRADLKHDNPIKDYKKAIWYLEREIKRLGGDK